MIRRARDALALAAGLGVAHHSLVLAARWVQARDAMRRLAL
jgi:hypothetical protein